MMFMKSKMKRKRNVQPVQGIAEACVNTVLSKHMSGTPSLICLPVQYACGGTTRE